MQFYVLQKPPPESPQDKLWGTEALTSDPSSSTGEAPRCEACGDYVGMRAWIPPYEVELETWGKEFGDVMDMTYPDLLVSQRFRDLWKRSGMVGLTDFEPVAVVKVRRHRRFTGDPPPYYKARAAWRTARLDLIASDCQWAAEPDICPVCQSEKTGATFLREAGIVLEPGTWNGEDIFVPRATSEFLTTSRFKQFCEDHRVTNTYFLPAETYVTDFYPDEPGCEPPPKAFRVK
jgi:hypothetical protein